MTNEEFHALLLILSELAREEGDKFLPPSSWRGSWLYKWSYRARLRVSQHRLSEIKVNKAVVGASGLINSPEGSG